MLFTNVQSKTNENKSARGQCKEVAYTCCRPGLEILQDIFHAVRFDCEVCVSPCFSLDSLSSDIVALSGKTRTGRTCSDFVAS
jgi:hypothetical protein